MILLTLITTLSVSAQQTDFSLAKAGDFVLGVYLFINCEPVNAYDYVGKIDKFDVFESNRNDIEKIIKKARKKNPFFDGMIFKRDFKHVELIKFEESHEKVAGFKIGDIVSFIKQGEAIRGTIVALDDAKQKAIVEYSIGDNEEQIEKVPLKGITRE